MRSLLSCVLSLVAAVLMTGCGESKPAQNTAGEGASGTSAQAEAKVPSSFFTQSRPADVEDLKAVRDSAAKGDSVSFLARVGGRVKPFSGSSAVFVVTDPGLLSCEIMACDDHCSVPWDYCCEDPDDLKMGMASVRLLDEASVRPIRTTAEGAGGLEPLKFVVVSGTVSDINDDGLFVVDAQQVWVGGKPTFKEPRAGSE
ncbi:MAG: hypothetical protein MK101_08515 [Phycisphaerales bacterium]|nr:hypothetical protein [Phycisphaerales bacterium]